MSDYNSTGRPPRRNPTESNYSRTTGASRSSGASRPSGGYRASGSARPSGSTRPSGSRPSGSRPPQRKRRRRRAVQPRFFILIGIIAAIALALILFLPKGGSDVTKPMPTPDTPITNTPADVPSNVTLSGGFAGAEMEPEATADTSSYTSLADYLNDEDAEVQALAEEDRVKVDDLNLNTSLPDEWLNVLLLGTDERTLSEAARTDAMLICSINKNTGAVKLTSIMRDTAVTIKDAGKNNGTYRINSANYFGGPKYAMKTVNELLGMNIQHYVSVNFFGFQKIAQALGGIDVDVTEAEMKELNKKAVNQAWLGYYAGLDESDQINEYLTTFGPNTHLNGRQTLAYARVRSADSDFSRAERQRTVLIKLMEKLKGKSAPEIVALVASLSGNVTTNLDLSTIAEIAVKVLSSGIPDVKTFRVPEVGTYTEERRNDDAMLWDVDWKTNTLHLYNFIYED